MEFAPEHLDGFLALFHATYSRIRFFEGCTFLELHRDTGRPGVLYTMSHWKSEAHLESYRRSELFQATWAQTKQYFAGKPQAWSLVKEVESR
jgi:hypothetical protein